MNKKNIVIFGSGGHGWFPLFELLKDDEFNFTSVLLPVDWGGSTGVIGRLLSINNFELNFILHGKKTFPILPWGDFNKFVIAYLTEENKKHLNFRSDIFTELWDTFSQFSQNMRLEKDLIIGFKEYLKKYLDYLNKYEHLLSINSPTCLGNLWNQFLFFTFGDGFIDFYKKIGVFSGNINHCFVTKKRLVLLGQSIGFNKQNDLIGEDVIDVHLQSILPESLKLIETTGKVFIPSIKLLNILKQADYIIIPNGSIANWLPMINNKLIANIIESKASLKKVFWMVNLFKTRNEFNADIYYKYLIHRNINVIPLGPTNLVDLSYEMAIKYYKQSKELNNIAFTTKAFNLIDEDNYTSVEGLKHDPKNVYKYFKKVLTK